MDPSRKRALGDGSSNGGDSSKVQMVPHSDKKKVCRYCKREFKCGRGLGGHIKFHSKGRKMTKFSTRMNKRSGFRSFSAPPSLSRSSQVRGGEITDLSKFLNGTGWKVQKKRGASEARGKGVVVSPYSSSDDDDDYIECDEYDSCDEDDYDSIRLRKKLRRRGIIGNAHNICWTRRMLMCKVCDQFFRTYYALLCHVSEYLPIEGDEKENGKKGAEADRVAVAEESEGDAEGGVEKKEQGKGDVVIGDNNEGFGGVEGEKRNEEKGEKVDQVVGEAAAAEKNEEDAEGVAEVGGKEVQGKEDVTMGDNNEGFGGVEGEKENGEKGEEVEQVVGEAAAAVKHEGDTEGCIEVGEKKDQGKDAVMGEKESEEKGEEVEQVVDEGDAAEEKEGDAEGGDEVGGKEEQGKEDVVMGERESEEKGEEVEQVVGKGDAEGGVEAGEKEEQGEDVVMGEKESEENGEEVEEQVVGEGAAAEEQEGDAEDSVEVGEEEEQGKEDVVMGEEVGEKEEEEKEDVVMEDNNDEGFGGVEDGMDTKEFNEEVAEMGEKSGGGGGSKDEQMSTPVAPPKMLEFDLNEMPPEEED
ncbi:hypothetical protein CR513_02571, partial [Mucuna pruriens]